MAFKLVPAFSLDKRTSEENIFDKIQRLKQPSSLSFTNHSGFKLQRRNNSLHHSPNLCVSCVWTACGILCLADGQAPTDPQFLPDFIIRDRNTFEGICLVPHLSFGCDYQSHQTVHTAGERNNAHKLQPKIRWRGLKATNTESQSREKWSYICESLCWKLLFYI